MVPIFAKTNDSSYAYFIENIPAHVPIRSWVILRSTFTPDIDGVWEFGLGVAGQADLYINDELVVENSVNQTPSILFVRQSRVGFMWVIYERYSYCCSTVLDGCRRARGPASRQSRSAVQPRDTLLQLQTNQPNLSLCSLKCLLDDDRRKECATVYLLFFLKGWTPRRYSLWRPAQVRCRHID